MTIKSLSREICETCRLRTGIGCPIMESCSVDVIRLEKGGFPRIAYPKDCDSCFLCQLDCPHGAVKVSAEVPMPFLAKY